MLFSPAVKYLLEKKQNKTNPKPAFLACHSQRFLLEFRKQQKQTASRRLQGGGEPCRAAARGGSRSPLTAPSLPSVSSSREKFPVLGWVRNLGSPWRCDVRRVGKGCLLLPLQLCCCPPCKRVGPKTTHQKPSGIPWMDDVLCPHLLGV